MVKVEIFRDIDKRILSFKCVGHAESVRNPGDKDLVCAAVTAVIYAALGYMEEYYNMHDFVQRDGFVLWERPEGLEPGVIHNISIALDAMAIGLKQIEMQFSKNIKVIDTEV